jgi:serine/threonine-protein kinase
VKALKSTIAPTSPFAAQLEREARVLAELGHANIVALYDFVKSEQRMHLVLEYVDGWSLAAVLGRRARFSPELVCAIGTQMARGLAHAHERGVVHRDVKPANVIVSRRGEVKLCDFGIAQRDRLPSADEPIAPKRESDTAFGTPAFMSPEQILGETVDPRSDVFSLGVVLYQLLAGVRPFEKEGESDRRAAAQRIRREPARPLRERAPEVPRALERIVMRCVEKLPADRFESADEVADRLEELFRSRTTEKGSAVIVRALVAAGLVEGVGGTSEIRAAMESRASLRPVLAGFGAIAAVFALCGGAIQWSARGEREAANASGRVLELAPPHAGSLRVVASPWADVAVDGQHVDTTPFARAILLTPGTHYVTFTHPDAPAESRAITVVPGETIALDVVMQIRGLDVPAKPDGGAEARRDSMDGGS